MLKVRFLERLPDLVEAELRSAPTTPPDVEPHIPLGHSTPREVATAYARAVRAEIVADRFIASRLPQTARRAYGAFRQIEHSRRIFERALHEPFPYGRADHHLFFDRYLPAQRKRTLAKLIAKGEVVARLDALGGRLEVKGAGIAKSRPNGFEIDMRPGSRLVHRAAGDLDTAFPECTDVEPMLALALELDQRLGNGAKRVALESLVAKHDRHYVEVCAEYLRRTKFVAGLSAIERAIRAPGIRTFGDADMTVEVVAEHMLITNHASGSSFAIELAALHRGKIRVACTQDRSPAREIHVDTRGRVLSLTDFRTLWALTYAVEWANEELRELSGVEQKRVGLSHA